MTVTEWELTLPYPKGPPLRQNESRHHFETYRVRQQLQDDALILAKAARLPKGLRRVLIELHWQPAVKRSRDGDNYGDTLKPLIDGVVKRYGLCKDDSTDYVSSAVVIEPVKKPGRLWLRIVDTYTVEAMAWFERTGHCFDCGSPGTYCGCYEPCGCRDLHPTGSARAPDALTQFAPPVHIEQDELFG